MTACLCGPSLAETSGAAPPALRAAATALATERHGVIAFARHYVYDQRAPAHNKLIVADSARIRRDGAIVAVKLYTQTVDGTASSAGEIAKEQADIDKDLPDEDYILPLVPDTLGDYSFGSPAPCAGCDDGVVAVPFTSRKRDDSHGDGTAYVNDRTHHFVRVEFVPSVTPKHTEGRRQRHGQHDLRSCAAEPVGRRLGEAALYRAPVIHSRVRRRHDREPRLPPLRYARRGQGRGRCGTLARPL
jgi:hypothetical protein